MSDFERIFNEWMQDPQFAFLYDKERRRRERTAKRKAVRQAVIHFLAGRGRCPFVGLYAASVLSKLSPAIIKNLTRLYQTGNFEEVARIIIYGYKIGISPWRLAMELSRLYW